MTILLSKKRVSSYSAVQAWQITRTHVLQVCLHFLLMFWATNLMYVHVPEQISTSVTCPNPNLDRFRKDKFRKHPRGPTINESQFKAQVRIFVKPNLKKRIWAALFQFLKVTLTSDTSCATKYTK